MGELLRPELPNSIQRTVERYIAIAEGEVSNTGASERERINGLVIACRGGGDAQADYNRAWRRRAATTGSSARLRTPSNAGDWAPADWTILPPETSGTAFATTSTGVKARYGTGRRKAPTSSGARPAASVMAPVPRYVGKGWRDREPLGCGRRRKVVHNVPEAQGSIC